MREIPAFLFGNSSAIILFVYIQKEMEGKRSSLLGSAASGEYKHYPLKSGQCKNWSGRGIIRFWFKESGCFAFIKSSL